MANNMKYSVNVQMTMIVDDEEFTTSYMGDVPDEVEEAIKSALHEQEGFEIIRIRVRDNADD